MRFALSNEEERIEATPGALGVCPGCNAEMLARCGTKKVWHWAHKGQRHCDPWWENETEWHRGWKNRFPTNWQEVPARDETGELHIADIKTPHGLVIEFQPGEVAKRTNFYDQVIWIVDANRRATDLTQYERMLAADFYLLPDPPRDLGTVADPELEALFTATGAQIDSTEEPRAYYNLKTDRIHMPLISTFHRAAGYYGTLAHELTHWTGAAQRLDRFSRFNDRKAYAFEELVAEIGNCMLCAQLGLEPEFDQSAAYVEGWLKALKGDNRAIFRAASEAQKAVDYIMARAAQVDRMAAE
jgi:hypothetical protein